MVVKHEPDGQWGGGDGRAGGNSGGNGLGQPADLLAPHQRDLLWCLRRTAMHAPGCMGRDPHVHLLLQRRFGDGGLGLEHLLRCLVMGLAQRATRPIRLNRPCRAPVSPDEWRLLTALADAGRPQRVAAVLAPLTGSRGGELAPLLAGIASLLPA